MAEAQMQRGEEAQNEEEYQEVDSFQARRNAKKAKLTVSVASLL